MKVYPNCPSQRSGNPWVGFRLLTAIPEVPIGHNSGENQTSYHHCGVCVLLASFNPLVWMRLCSRWQSSLWCLMEIALNWYHVAWKTPLFFPLSCTTHCPLRDLWPFHLKWPDPDSHTEMAEMVPVMSQRRKVSIRHEVVRGLLHQVRSYWADKVNVE